ncbi:hypothetical protein [Streptomyces sp. NPDC059371]|uniref:hypothetical protein n=1 Tax=Streptomyces sp. NPDC059371 TaxID=3346812 RepID=UPI0036A66147
MTDVSPGASVEDFANGLDPYMRRILGAAEDPIGVVGEVMGQLIEPPYIEQLRGVGELYGVWGELSDIVDGYPVDYGPDAETIAVRESRQAAQDWLDMPHTTAGLQEYIEQWLDRLRSMPERYRANG